MRVDGTACGFPRMAACDDGIPAGRRDRPRRSADSRAWRYTSMPFPRLAATGDAVPARHRASTALVLRAARDDSIPVDSARGTERGDSVRVAAAR
jgi:hypothetical protein